MGFWVTPTPTPTPTHGVDSDSDSDSEIDSDLASKSQYHKPLKITHRNSFFCVNN